MIKLPMIYSKYQDNQRTLTSIEYINDVKKNIPFIFVLTYIPISAPCQNNKLDDEITVTKS